MKGVITVTPRVPCEAIQVTEGFTNIAKWCGGTVVREPTGNRVAYINIWHPGYTEDWRAFRDYWIVMRGGDVIDVCDPTRFATAWKELT